MAQNVLTLANVKCSVSTSKSSFVTTFFVTGIGTEVGKTVASAVVVAALQADYWKPVQCGEPRDTEFVRSLTECRVHPERYLLQAPMSPHAAAAKENVTISLRDFKLPEVSNHLVVEGAGGLLVPLNDNHTIADLISHLSIPALLVSRNYLGSINHTLLSIAELKRRNVPILGVLFNGPSTPSTESIIATQGQLPIIGRIDDMASLDRPAIEMQARALAPQLIAALKRSAS